MQDRRRRPDLLSGDSAIAHRQGKLCLSSEPESSGTIEPESGDPVPGRTSYVAVARPVAPETELELRAAWGDR